MTLRDWLRMGGLPILFCLAASASSFGQVAVVTRGPYLQMGTPSEITIRWRTDAANDGRVRYGASLGSLDFWVDETGPASTEHSVRLTGLTPSTKYFYSVGTPLQTLEGDDADYYFVSSPPVGTRNPVRIWALGDSGTANYAQGAVRDAYYDFNAESHADVLLMLGDNAYPDGTDDEFQQAVFDATYAYESILKSSVLWSTFGNHDGHKADSTTVSGPYYDIFDFPTAGEAGGLASGTEAYYSFDYGNIHFICLNSVDIDKNPGSVMFQWLESDIESTDQDWVIAFWHYPPYSKGSHDSDTASQLTMMRENALPILEDVGVDLVLSGHSHSYERSFFLDSHYGTSETLSSTMLKDSGSGRVDDTGAYAKSTTGPVPHEGAVYIVAGSSGKTTPANLNHAAMYLSLEALGSVVIDVNGSEMKVIFLDDNGDTRDYFTLRKGAPGPPQITTQPSNLTVFQGESATFSVFAFGSSPISYQWQRNGLDIAGATNASYTISATTLVDDGAEFRCSVSNGLGSVTSDPANLYVVADTFPPRIVSVSAAADSQVLIQFSEALEPSSATTASNYQIAPAVTVTAAMLSGPQTITLQTSTHVPTTYALTVNDVEDLRGNPILPDTQMSYTYMELRNLDVGVATADDDAEESSEGAIRFGSTDLELVYDGSDQTVGMRFTQVDIAPGMTVLKAYVQFKVDEPGATATDLTIRGEAVDDAGPFTTSTWDISSRARTSASRRWIPAAWYTVGAQSVDQRTPDIAYVIQEIVNRPGWSSGNALAVVVTGSGERTAESYNGDSAGAPLLHVEYSLLDTDLCLNDVNLSNHTTASTEVFQACNALSAGANVQVMSSGLLILRAGSRIVLGNGFSVDASASFVAEIHPPLSK